MMEELKNPEDAEVFFKDWQESLIWSCLQGIMGKIYVDSLSNSTAAMAILGDFCYFAGIPNKELVQTKPQDCDKNFVIMVPQSQAWGQMIETCYGEKAKKIHRYAIKKEMDLSIFNQKKLQTAVDKLSTDYTLQMINESLFYQLKKIPWAVDFVSQYETYDKYETYGLGVVVLKQNEVIAGASSYSGFLDGIEIEIITKEEHRQKGLAYVCASKLILECIKRKWYPSWDARTKISVALAKKLGYHFSHEYVAYDIYDY